MDAKTLELVSLENKVALITGGASGIGWGTAKLLAGHDAAVVLVDIDGPGGELAARQITGLGGRAIFVRCDVTSDKECRETVEAVIGDYGRIDILFNNAGVIRRKDTVTCTEEEWDLQMNVNVKSAYLLSHHVIPHMIKTGGGSIINTGSGWGLQGGPKAIGYCASKGAIVNLTRAMAIDHGKQNIRVNCVCPGDIDTPLLHDEGVQLGKDDGQWMKEAADRPLNRVGTPEDVAHAVLYLASGMSGWVTGTVLTVDGGGTA